MKELQELREDIMLLRNMGNIPKEAEMVMLRKLNSIEKQLSIHNVVGQSEQLVCSCGSIKKMTTGGYQCPNNKCTL